MSSSTWIGIGMSILRGNGPCELAITEDHWCGVAFTHTHIHLALHLTLWPNGVQWCGWLCGASLASCEAADGRELGQMVLQRFPPKKGRRFRLHHKNGPLQLDQTLQEQGIVEKLAAVSCSFVPAELYSACCYVQGLPGSGGEQALDKVTRLVGTTSGVYLQHLPRSLETLALGSDFNQTLAGVSCQAVLRV